MMRIIHFGRTIRFFALHAPSVIHLHKLRASQRFAVPERSLQLQPISEERRSHL